MKECLSCGETKPLEAFTRSAGNKSFKASKSSHHSYCKACNARKAKEWRDKQPGYYRGSGRLKNIPEEDRLLMSAIRQRLVDARARCKKLKKSAPTVTDDYLYELIKAQGRVCALSGSELTLIKDHPCCLSLDQIDPAKGYVEGNVQWLAWAVNRAKGELSLDLFYEMCEAILSYRNVQRLSP